MLVIRISWQATGKQKKKNIAKLNKKHNKK